MMPRPITEEDKDSFPGYTKQVFKCPPEVEDCSPIEALTSPRHEHIKVAWTPSEADLAILQAGGTIWLTTWSGLPPHYLEVI
jgi:hypothetical protein